jgi:hypothetical protein
MCHEIRLSGDLRRAKANVRKESFLKERVLGQNKFAKAYLSVHANRLVNYR